MYRLFYPYNEILPTKKAHDVFVFNECAAFAEVGAEVTFLCGKGSGDLFSHYKVIPSPHFHVKKLPIIRKNVGLNLSWNYPFFFASQRVLKKAPPNSMVILSVLKQASFHLKRKLPHLFYVYEVHELSYYPDQQYNENKQKMEKEMLARADLIVTTTNELSFLLKKPPYSLNNPIATIPLAVTTKPLSPIAYSLPFTICYVGQLYEGQGLSLLLKALSKTHSSIHLKVIGGKPFEIQYLENKAQELGISNRVKFLGFYPPSQLPSFLQDVHAFIAPFEKKGKMSYVAHTKLLEYLGWGRPIVAPHLDVVQECFPNKEGVLYFEAENSESLANTLIELAKQEIWTKLYNEISRKEKRFTWQYRIKQYLNEISRYR